jgi:dihydropteroate synthase
MGIVNLTDDSFSGDGLAGDTAAAVARAQKQIDAGADLLDLGAESSRPGALPVTAQMTNWIDCCRYSTGLPAVACRSPSIPTSRR